MANFLQNEKIDCQANKVMLNKLDALTLSVKNSEIDKLKQKEYERFQLRRNKYQRLIEIFLIVKALYQELHKIQKEKCRIKVNKVFIDEATPEFHCPNKLLKSLINFEAKCNQFLSDLIEYRTKCIDKW